MHRWPLWILLVGLFGICNFAVLLWSSAPIADGETIFFWLVQFYDQFFILSVILFPASMIIVFYWVFNRVEKVEPKKIIKIVGIAVSILSFLCAMIYMMFVPNLIMVDEIQQSSQVYYLVKYYDGLASDYAFCESDNNGFSGHCQKFTFQNADNADPQFYTDKTTGLLTVKFENSSSVWRISVHPVHIYAEDSPNN